MTAPTRWAAVGASVALLAVLSAAACLQPDPRGFGTHQRLGMPACAVQRLVGWRCPSCGMTTSWSHLTRGELVKSLQANSAGTMLGVLAGALMPWLLVSGIRGKWWGGFPQPGIQIGLIVAVTLTALVDWAARFLLR